MTIARDIDPRLAIQRQADEACAAIDAEIVDVQVKAEAKIANLQAKKEAIKGNTASALASMEKLDQLGVKISAVVVVSDLPGVTITPLKAGARATVKDKSGNRVSYTTEILRVLNEKNGMATIADIRDEVAKGPMSEKLAETDKGFYSGIEKLKSKGQVVKHRGWLFTEEAKAKLDREVASGLRQDVSEAEANRRKAPLADAVMNLIAEARTGIAGKDIVTKLGDHPEFAGSIKRNPTGAYNVLSRLKVQGRIKKLDNGNYVPVQHENGSAEGLGQKPEGQEGATSQPSMFETT